MFRVFGCFAISTKGIQKCSRCSGWLGVLQFWLREIKSAQGVPSVPSVPSVPNVQVFCNFFKEKVKVLKMFQVFQVFRVFGCFAVLQRNQKSSECPGFLCVKIINYWGTDAIVEMFKVFLVFRVFRLFVLYKTLYSFLWLLRIRWTSHSCRTFLLRYQRKNMIISGLEQLVHNFQPFSLQT